MTKCKIEYEVIVESEGDKKYTAIILKIDGQEFTLDKNDVSNLDGIITTVFDKMRYPFDVYLAEGPKVRIVDEITK